MSSEWGRGRGQGPTEPPWLDGLRQPACGAEMASKLPPPPFVLLSLTQVICH